MRIAPLAIVMMLAGIARAEDEEFAHQLGELEQSLAHPQPAPGRDTAPVGAPRFCTGYRATEQSWPEQIKDALTTYRNTPGYESFLIGAAAHVCALHAQPAAQHAGTELEQYWINETGLSHTEAEASLAARIGPTWKSERERLCKKINVQDDGSDDLPNITAEARTALFGCDENGFDPQWMKPAVLDKLDKYLDREFEDELVRLAWVIGSIRRIMDPSESKPKLGSYTVAQFDIKALAFDTIVRELDQPPYQNNQYAHVLVLESIAHTKLELAKLDALIAKQTADPKWKELLITTPQNAAAAWRKAAEQHKEALKRSTDMRRAIDEKQPAARGCEAVLRKDVEAYLKPFNKGGIDTLLDGLNHDPLAGILMRNLQHCLDYDGDPAVARMFGEISEGPRLVDGPRAAAYFATRDALRSDRREPLFDDHELFDIGDHYGQTTTGAFGAAIASLSPVGKDQIKVTFVKVHELVDITECTETNKVDRVLANGKVEYRKSCHSTGKQWVDRTDPPITIPKAAAAHLARGRFITWQEIRLHGNGGSVYLPEEVYADKSKKKLYQAGTLSFE